MKTDKEREILKRPNLVNQKANQSASLRANQPEASPTSQPSQPPSQQDRQPVSQQATQPGPSVRVSRAETRLTVYRSAYIGN